MKMNVVTFAALLLFVGGLIHTIPTLSTSLGGLFGGTPVIQIAVGIISMIVALVMFFKREALS
jgi:hypothetical protein